MSNTKAGLKPYPAYKELEIPWLGKVPTHWTVAETKNFYEIQMGKMLQPQPAKTTDIEVPYLKAVNVQWYSVQTDNAQTMWASPEEIEQLQVIPGDLLVCEGGEGGRAGIAKAIPNGFIIQNALHRVRPKRAGRNELLQHLMKVISETGWFDAINNKATIAHFTKEKFASLPIPVPPLEEQDAIVRYLDGADQRIRAYVSAKEKFIALLEEERQAVIHQAVTKGLDPNVKLMPSGVEWLGDVPEHWEVTRLKKVATIQAGLTLGKVYKSTELIERPYLRVANVQSGHLDLSEITTVQVPLADVKKTTLEIGDVLMTEGGDIDKLGRGCMWQGEIPGCLHQNHVFAVRPNPTDLKPALLEALMGTVQGRNYFHATAKQTTNLAATNRTTLGEFPMCLPSIREQQAIVEHVTKESSTRDAAIDRARRQIELIEEYRTRLIADVVTGKIDVREAKP